MPPFEDIPLVDGHLHPPLLAPETHLFAQYFTEAADSETLANHAANSLHFQWAMRELANLLHCEPDPAAVQEARRALSPAGFLRLVVREANVAALLVDDGYPPQGALTVAAIGRAARCEAHQVLRIETLAESLLPEQASAADLTACLLARIEAAPAPVALKSIIAYRSGLQVSEPSPATAEAAFQTVLAACEGNPPRLTSKPLLDFLLLAALEWAAEHGLPVQFHTGYGDRDIDLPLANPALLRPVLEDRRFKGLRVVLLHAGYPFCREASYLASVYPGVYVDWSEVNPMLPHRQLRRVLEELLALAPYTKLLYGSDAWGIPDRIYLGARAGRAALSAALEDEPAQGRIARQILNENARGLYRLGSMHP